MGSMPQQQAFAPNKQPAQEQSAPAPAPKPEEQPKENDNLITVKSPIIGTFYRKPRQINPCLLK